MMVDASHGSRDVDLIERPQRHVKQYFPARGLGELSPGRARHQKSQWRIDRARTRRSHQEILFEGAKNCPETSERGVIRAFVRRFFPNSKECKERGNHLLQVTPRNKVKRAEFQPFRKQIEATDQAGQLTQVQGIGRDLNRGQEHLEEGF